MEIMSLYAKRTIIEKVSYARLDIFRRNQLTIRLAQPLRIVSPKCRSAGVNDCGHPVQSPELHPRQHHTLFYGQPASRCRFVLLLPAGRIYYYSIHEYVLPTHCFHDQNPRTGSGTGFSDPDHARSIYRLSNTRPVHAIMGKLGTAH